MTPARRKVSEFALAVALATVASIGIVLLSAWPTKVL